ncbi:MAG: hypothetical protein IPO27_05270 [Bacteroidetes bacterium]|nr:hypothetical protein [Bacteroidota bacterium]
MIKQSGNDLELSAYEPNSGTPGNVIIADAFGLFKAGNVGIGTEDPSRAKLVVEGNVGKTTAIFGQGSTGISLVQNWPGIGFNSYVASNVWKPLSSGFGGNISVDPSIGSDVL